MVEEEKNPLVEEVKYGLGVTPITPAQQKNEINSNEQAREEIASVLAQLKQKMAEIDKITQELDQKRKELAKDSPKRTQNLLEEIKVPSLDMLK
jgi:DNA-binding ferritin-like protein